ncbi:hypothetical protein [Paracoccus xiamenensis]|uniref:hypothetical protein n=1 Tax=Paracoccus xiamenensis TaxID=2714901 RepID=UPI00140DFFC0|nr:hypothetical protein [Paracoccus xiamenensis]NHF73143.1 hypothetical protein [Paracoccus xiamenensis]
MSAALRLEDFARPALPSAPRFSPAELAAEYRRGRMEGEAAARDADIQALTAALVQSAEQTSALENTRAQAIREALDAVLPVLQAITRQLASDIEDRMARTIFTELQRLCQAGIAPTCRIAANARLIQRLSERIEELGLDRVTLLTGTHTEITFEGGRIAIDPAEITDQIAALLAELSPSEE